jgi:hypothetical protein
MWTFAEVLDAAAEHAVEMDEIYTAAWLMSEGVMRRNMSATATLPDLQSYDYCVAKAVMELSARDRAISRLLDEASFNIRK